MDFAGEIIRLNTIVGKSLRLPFTSESGGKSREIVIDRNFNDFLLNSKHSSVAFQV